MPEKPKAPKKKTSRAATPAKTTLPKATPAKAAKGKPPKPAESYFVVTPQLHVALVKQRPNGTSEAQELTSFADARRAAIDALVDAIELAESQLDALKRAGSYDDLQG